MVKITYNKVYHGLPEQGEIKQVNKGLRTLLDSEDVKSATVYGVGDFNEARVTWLAHNRHYFRYVGYPGDDDAIIDQCDHEFKSRSDLFDDLAQHGMETPEKDDEDSDYTDEDVKSDVESDYEDSDEDEIEGMEEVIQHVDEEFNEETGKWEVCEVWYETKELPSDAPVTKWSRFSRYVPVEC